MMPRDCKACPCAGVRGLKFPPPLQCKPQAYVPNPLQGTWMDTAMHDMGSLGHTLQIDLLRDWANLALYWGVCTRVWRGVVSRC